ncbi:n/a [Ectocarpus siliculosus]|uniref:N/a n=1 Tax=Ectocarpus siliculosus TaxID=2880 RepID=D8LJ51_ECTSI|nr:n/a [Ectocarpus siliculosus]|eukprot:CBN76935.1 n/a [Ectocarpus siliculosus]
MALFGDEDGDVGPFVMAEVEGGDEWFPFSLDNLEMDRACNASLQDDSRPMDQDGDGETDQDDDVDAGNPSAEASGPGPPPPAPNPGGGGGGGGNGWNEDRYQQQDGGSSNGSSGGGGADSNAKVQQGRGGARKGVVVSEPKIRLDKVKPEAKEVHASHDRKRHTSEAAAPAKRSSRGEKSGGGSSSKSRQKHHHPAGGMAGGVGGMTGRVEGQAGWTTSSDTKHSTRTGGGGDGGDGGTTTKASKTSSSSGVSGGGNGGSMTKAPTVQNKRRLERNAREQKRSLKISQRIEDLRRMLSQFGVDVKASKSAVLSEATDYIAHLQRQHAQSEAERARILQLLHNSRAASPSSAAAAAAAAGAGTAAGRTVKPPPSGAPAPALPPQQHGGGDRGAGVGVVVERPSSNTMLDTLLSLDDDGDMGRPTSAMTAARAMVFPPPTPPQQGEEQIVPGFPSLSATARRGADGMPVAPSAAAGAAAAATGRAPVAMGGAVGGTGSASGAANLAATARALSHVNYERVFRTLPMPMAIANVNGNLVDCNTRLTQVTGFRKEEALFMTIFDLVADPFLQHTFSMISSILSMRGVTGNPPFFQVPGKIFNGNPGGGVVQISAVHDDQLRPMHFCICILDSPATGGVSAPASAAAAAAAVAATAAGGTAGVGGGGGSGGSGSGSCVRIRANVG